MNLEPEYTTIDLENWDRKDHYELYKRYDDPFFNISANVDITHLKHFTKKHQKSFFLYILHSITRAVNAISEFRYRIKEDQVIDYTRIHPGCTILNPDHTFRFCYFTYKIEIERFELEGNRLLENDEGSRLDPKWDALNMIHCSIIPWLSFTSFKHARRYDPSASIPRITMGKYFQQSDKTLMPLSVEVHHGLMDGYHVGLYFSKFEEICAEFSDF